MLNAASRQIGGAGPEGKASEPVDLTLLDSIATCESLGGVGELAARATALRIVGERDQASCEIAIEPPAMTPDELVRRVRVVFGRRQSGVITGGDMSVRRQPARPRAQRQAENESYDKRARTTGLVQLSVVVPVEKVPVLKALAVEWRAEAWAMLETDLPTADQILQIHAVCRTLTTCHRSRGKEPALIQMSVRHQDLGYIDLEQKTLQPLDNPFGSRLSPMS